jgi:hypothetical protein
MRRWLLLYATGGGVELREIQQDAARRRAGERHGASGTVENRAHGATDRLGRRCGNRSCPYIVLECRLEYLSTGFANRSVSFPAGAQTLSSDLVLHSIRLG